MKQITIQQAGKTIDELYNLVRDHFGNPSTEFDLAWDEIETRNDVNYAAWLINGE